MEKLEEKDEFSSAYDDDEDGGGGGVWKEKNLVNDDNQTPSEDSESVQSVINRYDHNKNYLSILIIYLLNITIVPVLKYVKTLKDVIELDVIKNNITGIVGLVENYLQTNLPCYNQQDLEFKTEMLTSIKEAGAHLMECCGVKEEKVKVGGIGENCHRIYLDGLEKYFKYIIGKKGCTVRKVRRYHNNVNIFVPYKDSVSNRIIIEGNDLFNVISAIKSLLEIVQQKYHTKC